jgi:hypothetical protein
MGQDAYAAVNGAWPGTTLPAITRDEAQRAAKRLMLHFSPNKVQARRSRWCRRVWISTRPLPTGTGRGWWRLVHDVSHHVHRQALPHFKDHGLAHADLERKMVGYVVAQGWLDGRLRPSVPSPMTLDERRARRLAHAGRMLALWERRAKAATGRVRRWRARVRAVERTIHQAAQAS